MIIWRRGTPWYIKALPVVFGIALPVGVLILRLLDRATDGAVAVAMVFGVVALLFAMPGREEDR